MDKLTFVFLAIFGLLAVFFTIPGNAIPTQPCPTDPLLCQAPDCRCSSQNVPGNFTRPSTPQIVYLTFDDAVTVSNYPFYEEVIFPRKNPNNASIGATFFITHEYTNYSMVHELWRRGHDLGFSSITHKTTTQYWSSLNESMWSEEIVDQRRQMSTFANIPMSAWTNPGMRAPFLQVGGNSMYQALNNGNFTWECSRPTFSYRNPGLWPYTNDYTSIQDCQIGTCPDAQFKGFWTVPMIDFMGDDGFPCAMADECTPIPMTTGSTFNLLKRNFDVQYNGNRAPFGVFLRSGWLIGPDERPEFAERKAGYIQFLDHLAAQRDVFIVGISKALEWVKKPTPMSTVISGGFEPWNPVAIQPQGCPFPRNCYYQNGTWERYMSSCIPCPINYPWIHNPVGTN